MPGTLEHPIQSRARYDVQADGVAGGERGQAPTHGVVAAILQPQLLDTRRIPFQQRRHGVPAVDELPRHGH